MTKCHLLIVGFDEIVSNKYLSTIADAINNKAAGIDGYSIIELAPQKSEIEKRIQKLAVKPEKVFYLPAPGSGQWADRESFAPIFQRLRKSKGKIKVYIATELKAHEAYLRYCVENGLDTLVEKPIFAPIVDQQFEPSNIEPMMRYLLEQSEKNGGHHSVMTSSRYHHIYHDKVMSLLKKKMIELEAPLTSFHLRAASGVWNLHEEYETREDHPYKYGYGILMHGAYHFIDLATQFLLLNRLIYPDANFTLSVSSFAAHPAHQNNRISKKFSERFDDNIPEWANQGRNASIYGETDTTSTFCLTDKRTGGVLTLGTLSFEQTTPCLRSWKDFPPSVYNKNGRVPSLDFEAQLSTLYSINVKCYDVPTHRDQDVDNIELFSRVSTRANASLLPDEEYFSTETYTGFRHCNSNKALLLAWLLDQEHRSNLKDHLPVMRLVQALATSIRKPGYPVVFDL